MTFAEVKQVAGFRRDAAGREEKIRRGMTRSNAAHFLQRDVEWHRLEIFSHSYVLVPVHLHE